MKTMIGQELYEKIESIKKGRTAKARYAKALQMKTDFLQLKNHDIRLRSRAYWEWKEYEELLRILEVEIHALKAQIDALEDSQGFQIADSSTDQLKATITLPRATNEESEGKEKARNDSKENLKHNRAVDLWASKHERLGKALPHLELAGLLERTKSGYNWVRRQFLLLWLLITVEEDFSDWAGVALYFTIQGEKKRSDQLRAALLRLRSEPPAEWYQIEEVITRT